MKEKMSNNKFYPSMLNGELILNYVTDTCTLKISCEGIDINRFKSYINKIENKEYISVYFDQSNSSLSLEGGYQCLILNCWQGSNKDIPLSFNVTLDIESTLCVEIFAEAIALLEKQEK